MPSVPRPAFNPSTVVIQRPVPRERVHRIGGGAAAEWRGEGLQASPLACRVGKMEGEWARSRSNTGAVIAPPRAAVWTA